jgi:hypothetical protein
VLSFPAAGTEDFFVSGLDVGAESLGGTAALVDEAVGQGRSIVFSFDPVFRGWADGTQRILWNAIRGPDPFVRAGARAGSDARAEDERVAREAAERLPRVPAPFRLTVAAEDARAAAQVLTNLGARFVFRRLPDAALFVIANPKELSAEEHPFIGALPAELSAAAVELVSLSLR